jgi:hypothetical protein
VPLDVHRPNLTAWGGVYASPGGIIADMSESMVRSSTRLLRESADPLFQRLRELLSERGIDVTRSSLATFFPDDTDMEFGVIVAQDKRVFEFELRYGTGDLGEQVASAKITDWSDRTDWWDSDPHGNDIREAVGLIEQERG